MSTAQFPAPGTSSPAGGPRRDARTLRRVILAVIAPVPMLAIAINDLFNPIPGGAPFTELVAGVHRIPAALDWVGAVFVVGLIPATFAVLWATRRGAPRLTAVAALIAQPAFLAGFGLLPNDTQLARATVREGLDLATMAKLDEALWAQPLTSLASLLFIIGIVVGLPLLGAALWRSRVAPAWMGIALMVGGATHPFIPNHVGAAAGLALAAIGFGGATVGLLRMSDDDFDLPPTRPGGPA
jgi:hypothetical protein